MKNRRIWKQLSAVLLALAVVTGGFSVKIGNFVIWDMAIVAHAYDNVDLFAIYDQAAQFWQNQSNNLDDATRQNLSDSMRVVQTLILSDNPSSEDVDNGYTRLCEALRFAKMQAGSGYTEYVSSTCENGVVTTFTALSGNGYGSVNSELGGYYSSDSQYYKMLVDGNKNTKWCIEDYSNYHVNTYLEFTCDNGSFVPTGYILTTGSDSATYTGRNPKSWRIDGKKNQWDQDWTPLVTVTDDQVLEDENSKAYLFRFNNTEEYRYFRFYTNEVQNGNIFQLAELQLLDDSFILTKQEVKDATCTEDGNKITHYKGSDGKYYIARYGDNNEIAGYAEVAKEDAIIDALGHQFDGDNPEWNWTKNENGSYTVKAHAECSRCHSEEDFNATVTPTVVTTPTYAEDGKTVYTATVNIWGVDYTDTKEEAILANRDDVTYIGADGTEQTINAVEITGIMNRLTAGNYVVNDSVAFSTVVNVTGDVVLILADGGAMSANKGINITNGSLSIYAQSEGTGALTSIGVAGATPTAGIDGTVNIYGGVINATGGNGKDGAQGTKSSKTGKAGSNGACGINGTVSIYGGAIIATGGKGGNGGKAYNTNNSGGNGGNGGIAINGTVTVSGGRLILNGGNGGKLGTGKANKSKDGSAGAILGGTVALSGGTFNAKPKYEWLVDGFGIENVNDLWSVASVKYNKIDAVEPTLESEGNIEYYVGTNGKYYKFENEEYSEIAENSWVIPKLVSVIYNGNGGTGTVPEDSSAYAKGETVTVLGNTGNLKKDGYEFLGWATSNDATRAEYTAGSTFNMGAANVTLYAVWKKVYTVAASTRLNTLDTSVGNVTISNTAPYLEGDSIVLTAPDKSSEGYQFLGWYDAAETEFTAENQKAATLRYEFDLKADTNVVAVYEARGSVDVKIVAVNSAEYTVDGSNEVLQDDSIVTKRRGSTLTLHAQDANKVLQWQNASGKVLGTGADLAITVTGATEITLVYNTIKQNQSNLQFVSDYGQVLYFAQITNSTAITFPAPASKAGYNFVKWVIGDTDTEATADNIKAKVGIESLITIKPCYTKDNTTYKVTVNYRNAADESIVEESKDYADIRVGTSRTFTAPVIAGYKFQCWKNGDQVLGYDTSYVMKVMGNVTLTACYVAENVVVVALPTITLCKPYCTVAGDVHKITCIATRDVPEGYTLVEQGMLYARDVDGLNESNFVIDSTIENIKRGVSSDKALKGTLTVNIKTVGEGDTWKSIKVSFRGYMILRDNATGNETCYYTGIEEASYNTLNPQD